jgi:hypothetical protein
MSFSIFFFFLTLFSREANAALYPTKPVSGTVYTAGHLSVITWENSKTKPNLRDMGQCNIELFSGDVRYTLSRSAVFYLHTAYLSLDLRDHLGKGYNPPQWIP